MDGDLQHDPSNLPILIKKFFQKKSRCINWNKNFEKKLKVWIYLDFTYQKS